MVRAGYLLPPTLQELYGVVIPRGERHRIAALAVEGNKCRDRTPSGQLINVMLIDAAACESMSLTDAELFAEMQSELGRYLPGVDRAVVAIAAYRWPLAEPRSPIGRACALHRYRAPASPVRRVYLAGDYMGAPYTEGAAETGAWAASRIIGR
jgi:protoporphyrinogen/coproporphyrinogen III oxidase